MQTIMNKVVTEVKDMSYDDCKEHLKMKACPNHHKSTYLSAYWKTFSVGVVKRDGPRGAAKTHMMLFRNKMGNTDNTSMALAYSSAWLMVPSQLLNYICVLFLF